MPSKGVLDPGRGPSYIRVTTPANLELALEGLVRKVLKEQPKQEDIYSFAADYFEHLVEIRDKSENPDLGVLEICPGRSEAEANELIKLATSFAKPAFLGAAFRAEPCNVVDVDQEGVSVQVDREAIVDVEGDVENIQEDEAEAENLMLQEPEEEVTAPEQLQESKLEEEESEVPRNSDPDVSNSEPNDRNIETESEEILAENTAEIQEGEPKSETETLISGIAENPEDRQTKEVAQDQQSEDVNQDTVTDVTDGRQSEEVVQDKVSDVQENAEDLQSVDDTQEAARNVTEDQKSENAAQNTVADHSENVDDSEAEVTSPDPESANDGKVETEQALHDDIPAGLLSQDEITEKTVEDQLLQNDETVEQPQEMITESSEVADLLSEDTTTETPTESTTKDIPSELPTMGDLPTEDIQSTDIPTGTPEPLAETNLPSQSPSDQPATVETFTEDGLPTEIPTEPSAEAVPTVENIPTEVSTEASGATTEDTAPKLLEIAQTHSEDSKLIEIPTEVSAETGPSTEDTPPELPEAELPTDDSNPTKIPTETSGGPESGTEDTPPELSDAQLPTEDSNPTEIPTETEGAPESNTKHTALPEAEQSLTEDSTSPDIPTENSAVTEPTIATSPSPETQPELLTEPSGNGLIKSNNPSLDLIAAETEPTEMTKERDIIKEFLEREQEFTTMGNSTRSLELVDVHLEDPPSDLSLTSEATTGLIGGTMIENSVFEEEPNQESVGGLIGGVSLLESKGEGLIGGTMIENSVFEEEPNQESVGGLIGGVSLLESKGEGLIGGTKIENSVFEKEPNQESVGGLIGGVSLLENKGEGLIGGTMIENSVFEEEPNQKSVGGLIGGVSLLESKGEGLIGGVVIPDSEEVVSEEPITASLIGGISHALSDDLKEASPENLDVLEKHDVQSSIPPVSETQEVVEQASAVVDDVLQEAAGTVNEESSLADVVEEDEPTVSESKVVEPDEASLLKDDSGSNHSRSSKESESLDEENPFISAEVKTLVQEEPPTVVETDSQEDEADVIIPLNAEIGTIQESDEGRWDAQLTFARAAIVIQKNFRKYLQRKNKNESFTRSEDVGKESTSTDSSLSSSATKIRQSSRTIESSRSDASFNESKLIKTKAKSMSTVPDSEVWNALEQELEESGNTQQNSHRQKLRREDAVQITTTASEDSATESPKKQRLLGTGELHDLIVPEEN